jgi:hypothetical protein
MLKRIALILCAAIFCASVWSAAEEPDIEKECGPFVEQFIDCVKNNKIEELSRMVQYPLHRPYPIPPVVSADDFIKRYKQIFDEELIKEIANSDARKDWHTVGWRGTMLQWGVVWLDEDGKLYGVNATSPEEKALRNRLIEEGRAKLHPSLRIFLCPVLQFRTEKFLIRIDDMGGDVYRYAAWSLPKTWSDEPDIVIQGGSLELQGSIGFSVYTFKNGGYRYVVSPDSPVDDFGDLEVFKGDERLLHQEIIEILY